MFAMICTFQLKNVFLGPFTPTLGRSQAVDFTPSIGVTTHYTIVVPMRFEDNLLSITDPLSFDVWICFLISIPSFIAVMCLLDNLYSGYASWEDQASFAIRNALHNTLSEQRHGLPDKHLYQKLLVAMWSWMMMVLVSAYSGNLIALITMPSLDVPFVNAEEMIDQTKISWGILDSTMFTTYAKSRPPETVIGKMIDKAIIFPDNDGWANDCYTSKVNKSQDIASVCDISSARDVVSADFSKTGTCNYYLTQDKILSSGNVLALQVTKIQWH